MTIDYSKLTYQPQVEKIVDILCQRTQNYDREFFRLQTNFYITLVASCMGTFITNDVTGSIPVNFYGVNLASSGSGKGFSTNVLENELLAPFIDEFTKNLIDLAAKGNIEAEALKRSNYDLEGTKSPAEWVEDMSKEYSSYGAYKFTFDSATSPAIKQFRRKILLAGIGSLNLIVDEVGANLKANLEPLSVFLELYDKGLVKEKLVKSTQENTRYKDVSGYTPANLLMFGTPSKLLDGGSIEDTFFELAEMGYARRCFFAYSKKDSKITELEVDSLYDIMANKESNDELQQLAFQLYSMVSGACTNMEFTVDKPEMLEVLKYRQRCERLAEELPDHQVVLKSELSHRYFKVIKLAGAYTYLDMCMGVSIPTGDKEKCFKIPLHNILHAIRFAEDSGEALQRLMAREKPYEKLAKFIAGGKGKSYTQVDLMEELPYYKGSMAQKTELMSMAIAWGYTNNIIIKKSLKDNVEFFTGESLNETNLNQLRIAGSNHFADNYENQVIEWNKLPEIVKVDGYNWVNHHCVDGKRSNDTMIAGSNLIVLDVDKGISLAQARELLSDYTYLIHTTKRHQVPDPNTGEVHDRFRVILPSNYMVKLSEPEYKTFMMNVQKWCPFELDTQTFQRSRKWACYPNAEIYVNEGKLLDITPFIPKTTREAEFSKFHESIASMDSIERWFAQQMQVGNRNNNMLRFALLLLDNGYSPLDVEEKLMAFNAKLANPLEKAELEQSVFITVSRKYLEKRG